MTEYSTGFLPMRSDSFPHNGESAQAARRYALTRVSDWNWLQKWEKVYIPANPAVVSALTKMVDDSRQ